MASELKVDKFTGVTTAGSILVTGEGNSTTTNLQQGLCKAWATCTTQTTTAVADSNNNASVTDNGTGDTTFTLTNNMNNNDYFFGTCNDYNNQAYPRNGGGVRSSSYVTTSTIRVEQGYTSSFGSETKEDTDIMGYGMQGDLA